MLLKVRRLQVRSKPDFENAESIANASCDHSKLSDSPRCGLGLEDRGQCLHYAVRTFSGGVQHQSIWARCRSRSNRSILSSGPSCTAEDGPYMPFNCAGSNGRFQFSPVFLLSLYLEVRTCGLAVAILACNLYAFEVCLTQPDTH